jgi:uncharacterized protein
MTSTDQPYLPEAVSEIYPDALSQEFWDRCARHELVFQKCRNCGTFRNPPGPICYVCRSTDADWTAVSGEGTLYSYTIVTHPVHPALVDRVPFNVSLVEFPDAPGVRLITNVVDADPEDLEIGMPVRLHWDELSHATLPRFEKA